jgi:hypothetical protein
MKVTPTGVNEAIKSLQSNRFYPLSKMAHYPNLSGGVVKGTGFQPAPPPAHPPPLSNTRGRQASSPQLGATADGATSLHPSFADIAAVNTRGRYPSVKRKDLEVSPTNTLSSNNPSKHARYDRNDSGTMKAVADNLSMLEQVANELLEASSSDPVLVAISSRLCQGMITQNNIMCDLLSRAGSNIQQVSVNQEYSSYPANLGAIPKHNNSAATAKQVSGRSQLTAAENNRRTLKQPPLGQNEGNGRWQEVTNHKHRGNKKSTVAEQGLEGESETQVDNPIDHFADAVKNAEKAVVIYNLNLGQAPLLNPATISSKVTSALIKAAADNFKECGNSTAAAGEMVNDLLSQVKSMDLFGKGTKPCKDPKNPGSNGAFYTVPVKLTFSNKQVSKHVNEILRQKYKVSTSIPYHRTLKQAITMAHEKVSKKNPGKQVLISLDAPKKCLKPFIRDPPSSLSKKGESGWLSAGNPIPLPGDALNTKLKEVSENFSLPASPTPVQLDRNGEYAVTETSAQSLPGSPTQSVSQPQSGSGRVDIRLKATPEVAAQLELRKRQENDDNVFESQGEGESMNVLNVSGGKTSSPTGLRPEY